MFFSQKAQAHNRFPKCSNFYKNLSELEKTSREVHNYKEHLLSKYITKSCPCEVDL